LLSRFTRSQHSVIKTKKTASAKPLYVRLKREGRILRGNAWELCTLFDINFLPKNMSATELQSGFLKLVKQLYSAEETRRRRTKFKRMLKISPNIGRSAEPREKSMAA
jgi:hypothetical protein